MKRIISLLLVVIMGFSITFPSFAAENTEKYYTIQVEYSDNIGHQEPLDVMIQNDNVFVNAGMLAERLGYISNENDEGIIIYNKDSSKELPFGITQFRYDSTRVSHMLFNNMIDTYEAPFASISNNKGKWIPFEYSLLLLNSSMMVVDDTVLIDIPTKRIIDYFYDIALNAEKYNFDWANDFGYTEADIKILGASSHLINIFNGVLGFDGPSWTALFQQFSGNMSAYDKKYGQDLSMLLCTESDKELQATITQTNMLIDVLSEDGKLGELLSSTSVNVNAQVQILYKNCEDILKKVKSGNTPLVSYNRSYQALEKALDRQTWFSNTGEVILNVQKELAQVVGNTFDFLKIGTKVLEVVGYTQEFQNQDQFSLSALIDYLDSEGGGQNLPEALKKTMTDYSDTLSSSLSEYTAKRFFENNIDKWILDNVPIQQILGNQAIAALFVWDIVSNTVPFISNGLSGADSFELALYALVFQNDIFLNYLNKRNLIFSDVSNITANKMHEVSQYCYLYLKSCYVTREAALASLVNKRDSIKEKIQPLIDYQNSINMEIAKIMVTMKGANNTNKGCVFGFLPSDNESYLSQYDDSTLIQFIGEWGESGIAGNNIQKESVKDQLYGSWLQVNSDDPVLLTLNEDLTMQYYNTVSHESDYNSTFEWKDRLYLNLLNLTDSTVTSVPYKVEMHDEQTPIQMTLSQDDTQASVDTTALFGMDKIIEGTYEKISFTKEQLEIIKTSLGVPEDMDVVIVQNPPYYWEAGQSWLIHVVIYDKNNRHLAEGTFYSKTAELCRGMIPYSG